MEIKSRQAKDLSSAAWRIHRIFGFVMVVLAVSIALIVPGFNLYTEYVREDARSSQVVSGLADRLSEFVARHPKTWDLQDERISDVLRTAPCSVGSCMIRVTLSDGSEVSMQGTMPPFPRLKKTAEITNGHEAVGTIVYHIDLSKNLNSAMISSAIGLVISLFCFLIFWLYPKRLISQALKLIDESQQEVKNQLALASRAQHEAEAANNAKSEFFATISHELRTPLTSIKGSLGLLKGLGEIDVTEDAWMLLDIADRNSDALMLLINDLLDFEKITSGSLEAVLEPHEIAGLTRNVVATNIGYATTYSVRFMFTRIDEPVWANIDKNHFDQILRNLLSNAAKFSEAGNSIEISVVKTDALIRISVRDFGVGIPESYRTSIFERFTQADASDTRSSGGTGLGLAISKALVDAHSY